MGLPNELRELFMAAAAQSSGPNFDLIENSLRFRGGQHLTRTNASAPTNQYKATFSVWVKVSGRKVNGDNCILQNSQPGGPPYSNGALYYETNSGWYQFVISDNSNPSTRTGRNSIRDHSAWYHVVFAFDHTQSTSEDGMKIYVNGLQRNGPAYGGETAGGWADAQNQALSWLINGRTIAMGHSHTENNGNFDGYMAEFHCIDGQMLDPTSFGEYEENGVWIPKKVSGIAYGNNGWYLDFSDPSNIGADRSGNGNNWTPSGFELSNTTSTNYDWMEDTPTKNFGTWNPLGRAHPSMSNQVADADLKLNFSRANGDYAASTTYMMHPDDTTNYYWEIKFTNMDFGASVGVVEYPWIWNTSPCVRWNSWTGNVGNHPSNVDGNPIANIGTFGNNDIIGCAWNGTNKSIQFYKNGTVVGTPYSPASTEGRIFTPTTNGAGNTQTFEFNTGNRPLAYTPPSGYVPLSTVEMSDVDITNPSEHFQTVLSESYPHPADTLTLGQSYGGGYYVGKILDHGKVYNLIVAPKVSGGLTGQYGGSTPTSIAWGYMNTTTGQTNHTYGGDASVALTGGVFGYLRAANGPNAGTFDITGASNGTGIGGYNDWYIPATAELQLAYRTMKPGTQASATNQSIAAAVPPVTNAEYTAITQSTNPLFQTGGSEAWTDGYYKSATEENSQNSYVMPFNNGQVQGGHWGRKDNASIYGYARAVRREFAYDAGILEYAQQLFPNGLWWIKDRQNSNNHQIFDHTSNRVLLCPANGDSDYVAPSGSSVAWAWALPASGTTNNSGSITTTNYVNDTAGMSLTT